MTTPIEKVKKKNYAPLKSYSLKQLAQVYDVDYRTLKKWLIQTKISLIKENGKRFSKEQVKLIYKRIGRPCLYVFWW